MRVTTQKAKKVNTTNRRGRNVLLMMEKTNSAETISYYALLKESDETHILQSTEHQKY
jgi:hypothetical protein